MLFIKVDSDIFEDERFDELLEIDEAYMAWWLRVVTVARKASSGGKLLTPSGSPATPRYFARIHSRNLKTENRWDSFFEHCVRLGLLSDTDEGVYVVQNVHRWWYRGPSDEPEQVAARVAKCRDKKRNVTTSNEISSSTKKVTNVNEQKRPDPDPDPDPDPEKSSSSKSDRKKKISFLEYSQELFRKFHPTKNFDENPVLAYVERNRGQPTKHGEILDEDLVSAFNYAAAATEDAKKNGKIKESAWGFLLATAQDKLASAVEWRKDREFGISVGEDPGPFRFGVL